MKFFIIIILSYFIFSCSTLRSYEKENITINRDTVIEIDTLFIRDTIRISEAKIVKGEPIRDTVVIYEIINGMWQSDTIYVYTKYAHAWAYVYNNIPYLGIKQDDVDIVINAYKTRVTVLEKQLTEKEKLIEKRYYFYENPWFWNSVVLFALLVLIITLITIMRAK